MHVITALRIPCVFSGHFLKQFGNRFFNARSQFGVHLCEKLLYVEHRELIVLEVIHHTAVLFADGRCQLAHYLVITEQSVPIFETDFLQKTVYVQIILAANPEFKDAGAVRGFIEAVHKERLYPAVFINQFDTNIGFELVAGDGVLQKVSDGQTLTFRVLFVKVCFCCLFKAVKNVAVCSSRRDGNFDERDRNIRFSLGIGECVVQDVNGCVVLFEGLDQFLAIVRVGILYGFGVQQTADFAAVSFRKLDSVHEVTAAIGKRRVHKDEVVFLVGIKRQKVVMYNAHFEVGKRIVLHA